MPVTQSPGVKKQMKFFFSKILMQMCNFLYSAMENCGDKQLCTLYYIDICKTQSSLTCSEKYVSSMASIGFANAAFNELLFPSSNAKDPKST